LSGVAAGGAGGDDNVNGGDGSHTGRSGDSVGENHVTYLRMYGGVLIFYNANAGEICFVRIIRGYE
jgi:hypothetical protein